MSFMMVVMRHLWWFTMHYFICQPHDVFNALPCLLFLYSCMSMNIWLDYFYHDFCHSWLWNFHDILYMFLSRRLTGWWMHELFLVLLYTIIDYIYTTLDGNVFHLVAIGYWIFSFGSQIALLIFFNLVAEF